MISSGHQQSPEQCQPPEWYEHQAFFGSSGLETPPVLAVPDPRAPEAQGVFDCQTLACAGVTLTTGECAKIVDIIHIDCLGRNPMTAYPRHQNVFARRLSPSNCKIFRPTITPNPPVGGRRHVAGTKRHSREGKIRFRRRRVWQEGPLNTRTGCQLVVPGFTRLPSSVSCHDSAPQRWCTAHCRVCLSRVCPCLLQSLCSFPGFDNCSGLCVVTRRSDSRGVALSRRDIYTRTFQEVIVANAGGIQLTTFIPKAWMTELSVHFAFVVLSLPIMLFACRPALSLCF